MKKGREKRHPHLCWDKIRPVIYTSCGIFCVGILFGIAVVFPKYYSAFNDNNTLNKVNYTDCKINTYETAYASFAEKLHAIARAQTYGNMLRAVRMNDIKIPVSRKDLAKIAREELSKLYKLDILANKYKPKAKKLSVCERYTIYEANGGDGMPGISCWKLVFENKKRTITLYLDEEYHKIYDLMILEKKAASSEISTWQYPTDAKTTSVKSYSTEPLYKWWDAMVNYYDLNSYSEALNFWLTDDNSCGMIEFQNRYQIRVYNINSSSSIYGANALKMGLLIENMIQF